MARNVTDDEPENRIESIEDLEEGERYEHDRLPPRCIGDVESIGVVRENGYGYHDTQRVLVCDTTAEKVASLARTKPASAMSPREEKWKVMTIGTLVPDDDEIDVDEEAWHMLPHNLLSGDLELVSVSTTSVQLRDDWSKWTLDQVQEWRVADFCIE